MIKKLFPKSYIYFKNTFAYLFLIKYKKNYRDIVVCKYTDFVIEGFPRSANTFATDLVKLTSKTRLVLARHIHSRAQIEKHSH